MIVTERGPVRLTRKRFEGPLLTTRTRLADFRLTRTCLILRYRLAAPRTPYFFTSCRNLLFVGAARRFLRLFFALFATGFLPRPSGFRNSAWPIAYSFSV